MSFDTFASKHTGLYEFVGETPNPLPTSFVAKKKGTDYSVLLFSISKVYASLSSRALQVGFADP